MLTCTTLHLFVHNLRLACRPFNEFFCCMFAVNNLSKTKLRAMRKQDVQNLCDDLGIDVGGCKTKADYVAKVLAHQQGSGASQAAAAEAQPAKMRVCNTI